MPRRSKDPSDQNPHRGPPADKDLTARLMDFSTHTDAPATAADVLDKLNHIISASLPLHVLAAARFPRRIGDWKALKLNETVFLHQDAPRGWWRDYSTYGQRTYDPSIMMARLSLTPFTWSESRRLIEPIGGDRWSNDLALKYGMRDGLTCPVGGRWVLVFWSRKVLTDILPSEARALIFMASCYAIMRIERSREADPNRFPTAVQLTPREQAVLQMAATGLDIRGIAVALELGEETIRTHLTNAKRKLNARNRTHAVAEAIRYHLIP
jgi:LuxR family transcriptional regulator, quorum-sensing system regulator BjaR1